MITINENVLQNKNVPSSAKLLLGYVQTKESVSETNEQLANRFGVTPVSITNWVSRLEKAGFVELKYEKRSRTITAKKLD